MPYRQVTDYCLRTELGNPGLGADQLARTLEASGSALDWLRHQRRDGHLPILALANARDDLERLRTLAREMASDYSDVIVLGTGGSSLGAQTLCALAPAGASVRLHFLDNIDPHTMEALIARLDLAASAVLVVSKSGGTAETLAQLLALLPALRAAGGEARLARRVIAVTEPGDNPLRRIALRHGFRLLDHDPGVGGRFSVLSLVGLLPALALGLDARAVREGAAEVLARTLDAQRPDQAAPALGAAIQIAYAQHCGVKQSVMMPYVDRLDRFAFWYRQLWAESLGKDGHGTTPVNALGAVDQHSQLQLYLDGPADKLYTIIVQDTRGQGPRIATEFAADASLGYLADAHLGDLLHAEQSATIETLARRDRPVRVFELASVEEGVLGALFMHFMLETIIGAHLLGVDPFDQPAVEAGKVLARRTLEARRKR